MLFAKFREPNYPILKPTELQSYEISKTNPDEGRTETGDVPASYSRWEVMC